MYARGLKAMGLFDVYGKAAPATPAPDAVAERRFATIVARYAPIENDYLVAFTGQSRATRDLARLADLIERLRVLVADLEALAASHAAPHVADLLQKARGNVAGFEAEAIAIAFAKSAGPVYATYAAVAGRATLNRRCADRHLASPIAERVGARDVGLLDELIVDAQNSRRVLGAYTASLDRLDLTKIAEITIAELESTGRLQSVIEKLVPMHAATMLKAHVRESSNEVASVIASCEAAHLEDAAARKSDPPETRGQYLLDARATILRSHEALITGRKLEVIRPRLIQRHADALKSIRDALRVVVKAGARGGDVQAITGDLSAAIDRYQHEIAAVTKARRVHNVGSLSSLLGQAANDDFAAYLNEFGGREREVVDLGRLGAICDRLREIAIQMDELALREKRPVLEKNRGVVQEKRVIYEEEFVRVAAAQGAARAGRSTIAVD